MIKIIIDAIVSFFTYILSLPVFPNVNQTLIDLIPNAYYNMKLQMADYNWIFPVDTFFDVMTALLIIFITLGFFKLVRYIGGVLTGGLLK